MADAYRVIGEVEIFDLGNPALEQAREALGTEGPAEKGEHRRVPPADLLIAATAEHHQVALVHHDADYPLIAEVSELHQEWFIPPGALAA